jgi:hypothetical protein
MHLLAPGSTSLPAEQIETVLCELAKVLKHYNFAPLGDHDTLATAEDTFADFG